MDFRILGPLEAHDGDRPLPLGGTRQRALLALLLLHVNEVVSSDRLIDELWGGGGFDDTSKALQVAVSRLRRALEPGRSPGQASEVLVTRPPGYELRLAHGRLDLHRFEDLAAGGREALAAGDAALAAQRLGDALRLWRGPPLADLGYESFAQAEIARLEERRIAALEDRIAADLELGRHGDLVAELRELVEAHPLRERLREQLMLALYRAGRQADALDVYQDARQALTDGLGIEPGRELRDLQQAILRQDEALDTARDRAAPPPAGSEALAGRAKELAELVPLLERALSGRGGFVLIGGEPGIGKSRLAETLAGQASVHGARILPGRCWEAGGAPAYWPWIQALRAYARESDPERLRTHVTQAGAELAMLVPELGHAAPGLPVPADSDSGAARFRVFESVASFLRSAAAEEPLALFFDDLHAADAPSLLLLRFVAAELADAPILIVGCYRDTEVGPGHPLAEALPELSRETGVHRVLLRGLSAEDTRELIETATGRVPPDELSARVHSETEGNPLFAVEVARLLAAEGRFDQAEGPDSRLPIPQGVKEAIARRLQRESERCREVLTLASVLGREFDLDVLARTTGLPEDDLFEALDEAVTARLVDDVPGSRRRLRFAHVLMRDAVYDDLAATRRLRLHREAGAAVEAMYAGNLEPHLAEIAHHYRLAGSGEAEKAIAYSGRAGDRAAAQAGYEEAARQYSSALELAEAAGSEDAVRACELLLSLGGALSRAGETSQSKEAFLRAAELAERSARPDLLAGAALGYGGRFVWARAGSDTALVPLLERALAAVGEDDTPARVMLLVRLACASRDEPLRDRRVVLAHEAVAIARRLGDPATLAHALEGRWPAVEGPDNVDSRIGGADELVSLAGRIGDKERAFMAHDYRLHTFWALADRAGVDLEIESLQSLADDLRQPAQRWHIAATGTVLELMEGGFERAEELIGKAVAVGGRAESWNSVVSQRLALFVLRREQGRLAELAGTIRRSALEFPALPRFRSALAHLYAQIGRERDARATLDELLSHDLAREYLDAEWLFTVSLLPDVCAFLGDEAASERVYALLLPYAELYAEAPLEATFGSVARGLGVLATELGRFDDAEEHFNGALETELRMGGRPWHAHAQHDLASMLLKRGTAGDEERARALVAEASAAYRALGMETWSARAEALLTYEA